MAAPTDPATLVEVPGPWQHRHVAANGARFHVAEAIGTERRDAPVVMLLHGFPEFWWTWRHLLPALADHGYRAVAMDLRGYGGSDKPPRGYDPFTLASDVVGVVKALGARRAVLVGQGWGGYVGWTAAALHPGQVTALCAVASPHPLTMLPMPGRGRQRRGMALHLMAMQAPFVPERRLSRPANRYVEEHLRSWSSPASSFPDEETARRYREAFALWPAAHCALEYHRWAVRSRVRTDGRRYSALMASALTVPVCLVHGADDPVVPLHAQALSRGRVRADVETHVLSGTGHYPHEEDPEGFAEVLLPWLARVTADR